MVEQFPGIATRKFPNFRVNLLENWKSPGIVIIFPAFILSVNFRVFLTQRLRICGVSYTGQTISYLNTYLPRMFDQKSESSQSTSNGSGRSFWMQKTNTHKCCDTVPLKTLHMYVDLFSMEKTPSNRTGKLMLKFSNEEGSKSAN